MGASDTSKRLPSTHNAVTQNKHMLLHYRSSTRLRCRRLTQRHTWCHPAHPQLPLRRLDLGEVLHIGGQTSREIVDGAESARNGHLGIVLRQRRRLVGAVSSPNVEDFGLLPVCTTSAGDGAPLDAPIAVAGCGGVVIGVSPVGVFSAAGGDHGAEPVVVGRIGDLGREILLDSGIDVLQIGPVGGNIQGVDLRQHLEDQAESGVLDLGHGIGNIAVTVVPGWTQVLGRHVGVQSVVEEVVAE